MKLDTVMTSQSPDIRNTPLQKKGEDIRIPETGNTLKLKLDPTLDVANISQQLAQGLESKLNGTDLKEWKNNLKLLLPKELQNQIEDITITDIAEIVAFAIGIGLLIASGVGILAALNIIGARVATSALAIRVCNAIASSPNITSVAMGLVPGMKNAAPNQAIAFGVSEAKNIFLYILPGLVTSKLANSKK